MFMFQDNKAVVSGFGTVASDVSCQWVGGPGYLAACWEPQLAVWIQELPACRRPKQYPAVFLASPAWLHIWRHQHNSSLWSQYDTWRRNLCEEVPLAGKAHYVRSGWNDSGAGPGILCTGQVFQDWMQRHGSGSKWCKIYVGNNVGKLSEEFQACYFQCSRRRTCWDLSNTIVSGVSLCIKFH